MEFLGYDDGEFVSMEGFVSTVISTVIVLINLVASLASDRAFGLTWRSTCVLFEAFMK